MLYKSADRVTGYFVLDTNDPSETFDNWLSMQSWGFKPIPIWKPGWPEDILDVYCQESEVVGIGGLMGKKKKNRNYYRELFIRLQNKYPHTKFHWLGLGVTAASAFNGLKPYSSDSSVWTCPIQHGNQIILDKERVLKEVELPADINWGIREDDGTAEAMLKIAIANLLKVEEVL